MKTPGSICILSHDFSKVPQEIMRMADICPERLLNADQIKQWVADLRQSPKVFATNSLYLVRELGLQGVPVTYQNYTDVGLVISDDVDGIGNIEILDRELEQSDRYLNQHAL